MNSKNEKKINEQLDHTDEIKKMMKCDETGDFELYRKYLFKKNEGNGKATNKTQC